MPIKTVDTVDLVPEAQRANAIERKDGKFSYEEPADDSAAQTALTSERAQHAETKKKLKTANENLTTAQGEITTLQEAVAKGGGAISADALKAINDRTTAAVSAAEARATAAEDKARKAKTRADAQITAIASGSVRDKQTLDEYLTLIEPMLGVDDAGNTIVRDAAGNPTGEPLEKAMAKGGTLRRKWAFLGTGSSGASSEGSDGDAPASNYDAAAAGKAAGEKEKAARTAATSAFT